MDVSLFNLVNTNNLGHLKTKRDDEANQPSDSYTYVIFKLFIKEDNINTSFYMNNRLP